MSRSVLISLRVLLVLLFAGSICAQVASGAIAGAAQDGPLAPVLTGLILVAALCVEVVLLSVWMLIAMVQGERIFDDRARADRWVNAAIGALVTAAVVAGAGAIAALLITAIPMTAPLQSGEPEGAGWVLAWLAAVGAGVSAALALLVVVMRRLLHAAIRLHSELAEVI